MANFADFEKLRTGRESKPRLGGAMRGAEVGSAFGPVGTALGAGLGFIEGGKEAANQQVGTMADAYKQSMEQLNNSRNDALRIDDQDKKAIADSFRLGWGLY